MMDERARAHAVKRPRDKGAHFELDVHPPKTHIRTLLEGAG